MSQLIIHKVRSEISLKKEKKETTLASFIKLFFIDHDLIKIVENQKKWASNEGP